MHVPAISYGAPDPLAAILPRADAGTLHALARFFEWQAAQCRNHAQALDAKAADAEKAQERRQASMAGLRRMGARVAVLARRTGSHESARAVLRERYPGWSTERLALAHVTWQKARADKRRRVRDFGIWKERLAGVSEKAVGERHAITARQVRKICADLERRLRAAL